MKIFLVSLCNCEGLVSKFLTSLDFLRVHKNFQRGGDICNIPQHTVGRQLLVLGRGKNTSPEFHLLCGRLPTATDQVRFLTERERERERESVCVCVCVCVCVHVSIKICYTVKNTTVYQYPLHLSSEEKRRVQCHLAPDTGKMDGHHINSGSVPEQKREI